MPPILFKELARKEYLPWSKPEHSSSHHRRQGISLRVHLIPYFDGCHLHEITTKMVEDYKTMRKRGRTPSGKKGKPANNATLNRELSCLKGIFKSAVKWSFIEADPSKDVKILKETPKKTGLVQEDEVARLLVEIPDHLKALVACAVYAGLRTPSCSTCCGRMWISGRASLTWFRERPTRRRITKAVGSP